MRTKNSIKNILLSFTNNIVINLLRFVVRTFFIRYIGSLYLGVNGLLTNVLSVLSLADLGISSAISFSLYKPLACNDKKIIKSLMNFYKKAYFIIGTVILILGLLLLPFLDFFVNNVDNIPMLKFYYLLFLINMVISYYLGYKRTLITADQKGYKIQIITMIGNLVITILQIICMYVFRNVEPKYIFSIYLGIQIFVTILENIISNIYITNYYSYLREKNVEKLPQKEIQTIKKNVVALLFHKIGSYFVDCTDNLIISKYLGLVCVGLYSNYYLIINIFNKVIQTVLNNIVSSLGNLNASESVEKKREVYNVTNFIGSFVFGLCSICFINLLQLFVGDIWLDETYILSFGVVIIISINFYVNGMMHINDAVKSSTGLYKEDKYVPIIQSIVNIVVSILLVKRYGLIGVFIGTLISSILPTIIKPIIIYKKIFNSNSREYFVKYIINFILLVVSYFISSFIISLVPSSLNPYLLFLIYGIISVIIPSTIFFIIYFRSSVFKNLLDRIRVILNSRRIKNG